MPKNKKNSKSKSFPTPKIIGIGKENIVMNACNKGGCQGK